jgi:hypothetical protein
LRTGFAKAKAPNTLDERSTLRVLPAALRLENEPVHWFAIDIACIYKNLPLSAIAVVLLRPNSTAASYVAEYTRVLLSPSIRVPAAAE